MAKSIHELMTSRSITERTDFTDYDMLDAIIASALKKLLINCVHFRKRVNVEENCMHDLTRAYEAVQGLSDLSIFAYTMMRNRISMEDVIKLHYPQVNFLQKRSWKVKTVKITGFCSASGCVDYV